MRLLLHSCCAPCTTYCLEKLRSDGHEVHGYFYNPNIHPYTEFRRRLDAYREYCALVGLDADVDAEYGLRQYLEEIGGGNEGRGGAGYRQGGLPLSFLHSPGPPAPTRYRMPSFSFKKKK
ncbi:MAG TPA: hypothetical protein DCQ13_07305, partial [Firmicutes bacterium]|nr:hypothetical protein [Bacillota bacterium]